MRTGAKRGRRHTVTFQEVPQPCSSDPAGENALLDDGVNAPVSVDNLPSYRPDLRCSRQYRRTERIEIVDRLDALRVDIPLEHPQHDLVGGKIRDGEAVLFDRLDVFGHVEMGGRQRAGAPARRRPSAGTRADRT